MDECIFGKKRFAFAVILTAVAYSLMDMFFHHVVLGSLYKETTTLWRPESEIMQKMWMAYIGYVVFSFLFVMIFGKGFKKGKCAKTQGVKYGLFIGLLYWGSQLLLGYPFHPWPDKLYAAWFGVGMIEFVILGFFVSLFVKPEEAQK